MTKPTMPMATIARHHDRCTDARLSLNQQIIVPLAATINSAPISDCHSRPALTRSPATIDGAETGNSTSVMICQWFAPKVRGFAVQWVAT
jgi:hypothetical protein